MSESVGSMAEGTNFAFAWHGSVNCWIKGKKLTAHTETQIIQRHVQLSKYTSSIWPYKVPTRRRIQRYDQIILAPLSKYISTSWPDGVMTQRRVERRFHCMRFATANRQEKMMSQLTSALPLQRKGRAASIVQVYGKIRK